MARAKNTKRSDGRLQSKVYLGDGKYKYVYADTQRELDRKVQEVKLKSARALMFRQNGIPSGSGLNAGYARKKERFPREDIRHMQLG